MNGWVMTDVHELHRWWEGASVSEQRALMAAHVERVLVKPVEPGKRRKFDEGRLVVEWVA